MCFSFQRDLSNDLKRFRKKRFAEFNFDSKILFNLWGWLWLPVPLRFLEGESAELLNPAPAP
ncbi:hypothetical protein LEP1GSC186_0538 [Leptospira noguchii serovar Autumnalis str. ZUN142]|uniref:Uncharacterized protein n=1 Tax=Leptospira noguchii serovar Autumnalis str. ZUN142 TaxID=1085540 RepID=M6UXP3_9LEPT|nr:hypothetical protein LEP1GSC186_0538 [Leptospira noguchii serovar Autumnalis str. ZUN142]